MITLTFINISLHTSSTGMFDLFWSDKLNPFDYALILNWKQPHCDEFVKQQSVQLGSSLKPCNVPSVWMILVFI